MMSMFFFFFFFFLALKDSHFIMESIELDSCSCFMLSVVPVTFFFLWLCDFKSSTPFSVFSMKSCYLLSLGLSSAAFLFLDPFLFLVMLELTVLPMILAILNYSKDFDKVSSVVFMTLTNLSGSVPFMYFSASIPEEFSLMFFMYSGLEFFVFLCFCLVLVCKLPIFLLHFWLTKAHVSASGLFSMLLASIMLKLGSFGLFKYSALFLWASHFLIEIFLSFSVGSMLLFFMVMYRLFDMKLLVACSSVVHMALLWPLVLHGSCLSGSASLFMMTGHALVSYVMFLLVTFLYEVSHSRSIIMNKSVESWSKTMMAVLFICVFLNMGLPPFIGFLSELVFCCVLFSMSWILLLFSGFYMVCCIFFVMVFLSKFFFGKKAFFCQSPLSSAMFYCPLMVLGVSLFLPFLL